MRFVCDSCRAQYMISDDKVGARAVKVRCKKCGHVILVRKQELLSEASAQPPPEPMPHAAANGASPGEAAQNESQSEAAQDEAAHNEAAHDGEAQNEAAQNEQFAREEGQNEQSARANAAARSILEGVADDEIGAVFDHAISSLGGLETDPAAAPPPGPTAEEREAARPVEEPPSNGASDQPGSSFQWFVAIDEKQVGPLAFDQLKQLWDHGEIGPDSLCWRAGLSDWSALSDVAELARLLAPKPVRPVIVAAAPVDAPYPVSKGPVESAFSAGSSSKAVRPDSPAPAPVSSVGAESGGWRPSAASALASLMKEEIETLAKPPAQRIEEPAQAAGLLDVPAPMVNGRHGKSLKAPPESEAAQTGLGAPHPYSPSFGYGGRSPSRRGWIITLSVCGGVLLLALAVVSTILLSKGAGKTESAAAPSTDREKSAAVATHTTANPTPPATAASDAPAAQPNQVPAAVGAKAVDSKPDAPNLNHLEPTSPLTSPTHSTGTRRNRSARTAASEITTPKDTERPPVAVARPAPTASDDDFDREFGGAEKRKSPVPKSEPVKRASVYVPPAPGVEIPESLGTGEIMRIVLDNKPAIKKCVEEQKKRDGSLSGKIVMSWTILASGKTTTISCASDEFKTSYMAQCMSGLIKGWQFPRHKVQGDPINFPFTF
ncbi:MAG TPA: adventurous gliding motility protein GltJ [Myxococcaceae bacterium]|nr:adventurous gliding motility protein GltJ [Myxococcaceae bacterium]